METRSTTGRFPLGRQSSLAPVPSSGDLVSLLSQDSNGFDDPGGIGDDIRLMYLAHERDLDGIKELLDSGVNVNFKDIDGRTALHIAACEGFSDVVEVLLEKGAKVDPKDRWGSTPLADAIHYKKHEVINLLNMHGAKLGVVPNLMHVKSAREVPEYEIEPIELDFTHSLDIKKVTLQTATWRGIQVAVRQLCLDVNFDEDKVRAFRDELALLQEIRHPNVVQFLGAVTQNIPMMIVTEYLPKGGLDDFLKRKGALKLAVAIRFALDIARGMNYLHEHKPEAIIHGDLEPSNILRDDSGHLKVVDFGVSKLLKVAKTRQEDRLETRLDSSCRYMAPEVFRNEEYDTKVDVFSFSLILQEMIEGCPPFANKEPSEVSKAYASTERPPFKAHKSMYAHGLKELIKQCWSDKPADRPTFKEIIDQLSNIQNQVGRKSEKSGWRVRRLKCFHNLELIWKKDSSDSSSYSPDSSTSSSR